ncbi:hypothetical protein ACVIIW_001915 [Bradyrhizobium sp. USDA 4449]
MMALGSLVSLSTSSRTRAVFAGTTLMLWRAASISRRTSFTNHPFTMTLPRFLRRS